jgi:hypothetical protein
MRIFSKKGASGFSASSTAEEVTQEIDGTGLTAIVTGNSSSNILVKLPRYNTFVCLYDRCYYCLI